jgi:hypothetical protein
MDPESIALARFYKRQIPMPAVPCHLREIDTCFIVIFIKEAELHPLSNF